MKEQQFLQIKQHYDDFYRNMLRRGQLPLRSTNGGFWGHIPAADIYEAFRQIRLQQHKRFLDLGSGDGKVVLIASLFCKNASGIEIDQELFQKSLEMQKNLGIRNATFHNTDFYEHSAYGFDAVFLYPDEPLHRKLESKLLNELSGKLIHCGHHFHPQRLQKEEHFFVNGNLFTIYTK